MGTKFRHVHARGTVARVASALRKLALARGYREASPGATADHEIVIAADGGAEITATLIWGNGAFKTWANSIFVYMTWGLCSGAFKLVADRFHRVLNRIHVLPNVLVGIGLYAWGGWALVSWGMFLRLVCVLHGTWLVNSATHTWGYRTYETPEGSTNLWWVGLVAFGEGAVDDVAVVHLGAEQAQRERRSLAPGHRGADLHGLAIWARRPAQ